jgi:hypothetical protein
MSVSQPSSEVYVLDVPEVKSLQATYYYNFFTPDESVNATGGVPANVLARPGSEVDSSFIQYSVTRAPRFVSFSWSPPKVADVGNQVTEQSLRNSSFKTTGAQNGSLIQDNIDKVVNEDSFASNGFVSLNFHDGQVDNRAFEIVSGSMLQMTLTQQNDGNVSPYKAAQRLSALLPKSIKPGFVYRALTIPNKAYGAQFYVPASNSQGTGTKPGLAPASQSTRVTSDYFERLKSVRTNAQVNAGLLSDIVARTISDPTATSAGDLASMQPYAKQVQNATNQSFSPALSEQDFKTFVPYVKVTQLGNSNHAQKYPAEVVGFIIDKLEVNPDGTTTALPPIIVDAATAATTADFQVKFNATYCYTIRTVALVTVPAINDDDGSLATVQFLVSSKPSNKVYVSTLKLDAPPPPGDIDFVWNYETDDAGDPVGLMVTWAFPVTSERDIKQFQVFKRSSVNDAFELQKQYNFDDSVVKFPYPETPDPSVLEVLTSPACYWVDDDFDWNVNTSPQKGLIYTVAAIDAHGLTSNYGAQFLVWFDRFQNRLQKRLVSHLGAPKPYPNLYLQAELFVDTIRVKGPHTTTMKVYFNPEYYYLYDDSDRYVQVLQTNQVGGSYRLQFLNADNLRSAGLDIFIDDRTLATSDVIASPTVTFGKQRKARKGKQ